MPLTRRDYLSACLAMAAWPEGLAAQGPTPRFEILDADTAAEIDAIVAQIIPSTDGPGAREAGVIYFIDCALATFAADDREAYRSGMAQLQQQRKRLFPDSASIASLTAAQQIALIRAIELTPFFELLRTHTVLGFLGNPSYGGNRNKAGWRQIGFEDQMSFQQPFGYYDLRANRE